MASPTGMDVEGGARTRSSPATAGRPPKIPPLGEGQGGVAIFLVRAPHASEVVQRGGHFVARYRQPRAETERQTGEERDRRRAVIVATMADRPSWRRKEADRARRPGRRSRAVVQDRTAAASGIGPVRVVPAGMERTGAAGRSVRMEPSALIRRPADGMETAALGNDPGRRPFGMGKKRAASVVRDWMDAARIAARRTGRRPSREIGSSRREERGLSCRDGTSGADPSSGGWDGDRRARE
jgi:hypothetical protein